MGLPSYLGDRFVYRQADGSYNVSNLVGSQVRPDQN